MSFAQFQDFIREAVTGLKTSSGVRQKTFLWFMGEVGELASALQKRPGKDGARELAGEFADVAAG